jgi:hypothetical protein
MMPGAEEAKALHIEYELETGKKVSGRILGPGETDGFSTWLAAREAKEDAAEEAERAARAAKRTAAKKATKDEAIARDAEDTFRLRGGPVLDLDLTLSADLLRAVGISPESIPRPRPSEVHPSRVKMGSPQQKQIDAEYDYHEPPDHLSEDEFLLWDYSLGAPRPPAPKAAKPAPTEAETQAAAMAGAIEKVLTGPKFADALAAALSKALDKKKKRRPGDTPDKEDDDERAGDSDPGEGDRGKRGRGSASPRADALKRTLAEREVRKRSRPG